MSELLKVLGLFDHNGVERSQRSLAAGDRVPGPYRVDLLMDQGVDMRTMRMVTHPLHKKIRDFVEHRTGVRTDLAIRGIPAAHKSDVILAILEDKSVLPSLMRQRSLPPYSHRRLSVVSCWWGEELLNGDRQTRAEIQRAIQGLDQIFVFSRNQVPIFEKAGAGGRVIPVSFGVDHHNFRPETGHERRFQVFSAGFDRGRDFATLVSAARLLPEVRFDIVTQMDILKGVVPPANVTVHAPTNGEEHRKNLLAADLIVIPTHDLAYPTGQSVLLEGMASGRPVVVTKTPAMTEYIDEGQSNFSMPLHDPVGVASTISRLLSDQDRLELVGARARATVEANYTFERMWHEIARHLKRGLRPAVRATE
ncbi:hypothetical protein C5B85_12845 [Pseudoclavibacter sp. AY1F1]|uniref:glycosyltransferase family 4 protein n=1 Tax=Pseudoclavibacter sp. AY1F1 TaxID=2080583 RepID=UPI000CE74B1A|nr:glycosyltransferase [Pseudoclavibacter sp. AY1F1]PPF43580.1 hypothetical protein C5B85_12845 [Pseudoclavibacter sp. AY1F1]